ncbi:hypothetical protein [Stenotrophomonas sp. TWI587]|uniref:hypothetical protein n=1 Tax=Stenotrophomonas sp. TWI587 TaxID=3136783 RepID=UPI00320A8A54
MADICIVLALVGSSIALALGVAVFPRKLRELLRATRSDPIREAAWQAQARSELETSSWTAADELAYQCVRAQQSATLRLLKEARRG